MKRNFLLFLCFWGIFFNFVPNCVWAQGTIGSEVRVAILQDKENFNLTIQGPFVLKNGETRALLENFPYIYDADVHLIKQGIAIGSKEFKYKHLMIEPKKDATVYVNRHPFRGTISILHTWDDRLTVINSINIEQYVKGVLYHEISHRWPLEAIKAQAVAARTYALYSKTMNARRDFDVTSDIYSQVYGGKNAERFRTSLGVDSTQGLILSFNKKILPAYFHAACGGKTEDANKLWDVNLLPLKGVVCRFCEDSPHFKWKRNYRLKDVQKGLNDKGFHAGLIKDIVILERDRSDRIERLKITARDGKELIISGKDFRNAIGPNEIKSNNYEIVMKGYFMDLIGHGWGHGVGLCQWGALGMARRNKDFKEILQFYYPGSQIVDYESLR